MEEKPAFLDFFYYMQIIKNIRSGLFITFLLSILLFVKIMLRFYKLKEIFHASHVYLYLFFDRITHIRVKHVISGR